MATIEKMKKSKTRNPVMADRTFLSGWLAFLRQNSTLLLKYSVFLVTDCHHILEVRQRGLSGGPEPQLEFLL